MPPFLIDLWAVPHDIPLACPPPPAGQPSDPSGFYDLTTVSSAFSAAGLASFVSVLIMLIVIYQFTRVSLGPRFVWRWWIGLIVTALLCGVVTALILQAAPTTALAGSCETSPDAFLIRLPTDVILDRSLAGAVWGLVAFTLFSLVATATLGRVPATRNGFFHNRGCPWPRFVP